jgi:hypothetical protein
MYGYIYSKNNPTTYFDYNGLQPYSGQPSFIGEIEKLIHQIKINASDKIPCLLCDFTDLKMCMVKPSMTIVTCMRCGLCASNCLSLGHLGAIGLCLPTCTVDCGVCSVELGIKAAECVYDNCEAGKWDFCNRRCLLN